MDYSKFLNTEIKEITSTHFLKHRNTGRILNVYHIELNNDLGFQFWPDKIVQNDRIDVGPITDCEMQIIDKEVNLVGGKITNILVNKINDNIELFALEIDSNYLISNVYRGGGGTILHVENKNDFLKHINGKGISIIKISN